jgi:hypothetical protein
MAMATAMPRPPAASTVPGSTLMPGSDGLGGRRGGGAAGDGPEEADLVAAVPADKVRRDAVQPRARVRMRRVVAGPALERDQERLGHQVVGGVRAEAAGHIAADRRSVPVEQCREAFRRAHGPRHHVCIVVIAPFGTAKLGHRRSCIAHLCPLSSGRPAAIARRPGFACRTRPQAP